ncbi:proteoglycan 4-like isoform X2 [Girardinichthys multiradiatus]|uniref:proteoglycan 4-like isoform X2 n=1 Tax=Girardinichthys multiradiatus TaxID=208333 RepID=UPI001FAB5C88|nr:proteoglycan 4-like isoform X2 [Girardinichthys multiradiatus]
MRSDRVSMREAVQSVCSVCATHTPETSTMDLDPTVIIPAVLFTVVAVYLASSLLSRKPDRPSSSSAGTNKPKVGYGDEVPPSRGLEEPLFSLGPEPAEKNRGVPDLKVKAVSEPAPEPVTVRKEVLKKAETQEDFPEQIQIQESFPEPVEAAAPVAAKEPELAADSVKELEPVKETVKVQKTFPEPLVAQKRFTETEYVPELAPEPVTVTETLEEPPIVPEPVVESVKEPEAVPEPLATPEPESAAASESNPVPEPVGVADPEPVVPEPAAEVVQQSETKQQKVEKAEESAPEPAPEKFSEPTEHVEEVSKEPEQEISLNDVAAAADELVITAENEPSNLEMLMKKEEVQEEQRIELTSDLTSL